MISVFLNGALLYTPLAMSYLLFSFLHYVKKRQKNAKPSEAGSDCTDKRYVIGTVIYLRMLRTYVASALPGFLFIDSSCDEQTWCFFFYWKTFHIQSNKSKVSATPLLLEPQTSVTRQTAPVSNPRNSLKTALTLFHGSLCEALFSIGKRTLCPLMINGVPKA